MITEFDGVLVDSTEAANIKAWLQVAEEMMLPQPLGQVLRRIQGARDEVVSLCCTRSPRQVSEELSGADCSPTSQVIMQLFHWTRNPSSAAKIAQRKEEIYDSIMNGVQPAEISGSRSFLDTLRNYSVSCSLFNDELVSLYLRQCVVVCNRWVVRS